MDKRVLFLLVVGIGCAAPMRGGSYPDLAGAMAELKFDSHAPSNSVVVLLGDPHMNVDPRGEPSPEWTTNLNADLVRIVNAMDPAPARVLVAGDLTSSLAGVPGTVPRGDWNLRNATNEMGYWRLAIQAFTNVAETNILWVPGNHDQGALETNAELCCVLLQRPPHDVFDLGGVHWLMMNGGNYAHPSEPEEAWVRRQIAATSPTQTLAIVVHQPPFNGTASERTLGLFLRDCLRDWPSRWYLFSGHAHCPNLEAVNVGLSNVASYVTGAASTNVFNGQTWKAGCRIICLSNGIAGTIYYHYQSRSFQVEPPPDWEHPRAYAGPFETVEGLLWRRLKVRAQAPEVVDVKARDSVEWYAYTTFLELTLRLAAHSNQATHFLLLGTGVDPAALVDFSADGTNWIPGTLTGQSNLVYSYAIPSDLRGNPTMFARFQSTAVANNFIAGWGLSTTNPPPYLRYPQLAPVGILEVVAGGDLVFTNVAINPYAPPDEQEFRLLSAPGGAEIEPRSGVVRWRPPLTAGGRIVPFRVLVTTEGPPPISAAQELWVNVLVPSAPILDEAKWQDGVCQFLVMGQSGKQYMVWASSNLVDWTMIYATNPVALPFLFTDPGAASVPQRYYRVTSSAL